ncbi:hypothetical protein PKDLPJHF_00595 [Aeromonas veronii]
MMAAWLKLNLSYPPPHCSCLLFMQIANIFQLKRVYLLSSYDKIL